MDSESIISIPQSEIQKASNLMKNCVLCPRECHADRLSGKSGYCKAPAELLVARAALHFWEEPCISGKEGSGTVFFSGCALGCVYCQNRSISKGLEGKAITIERLAEIFLELQAKGANNINLVTPSHYVPHIIEALNISRRNGLTLPIVYNCGGYEKTETLKMLEGYVDIYLPDLKYISDEPVKASLILNYDVLPAFGFFFTPYRTSHWAIESGNNFVFYENGPSVNVEHDPVSSEVTVLLSGTYEISYVFSFIEPANILISHLKNNVPVHTIPLANFTGALSDTIVLPLSAGDVLKWEFEFLEED